MGSRNVRLNGPAELFRQLSQRSLEGARRAFPAGVYYFEGITVEDRLLVGESELSYELSAPPRITYPRQGDSGIPIEDFVATWDNIAGAETVRFEIKNADGGSALKAEMAGDATRFALPNGWLGPGSTYTMGVEAIAENGNRSVVGVRFTTSG